MPTNLAIDDKLLEKAKKIGKHKTKKAAVTAALEEYINRKKQLEITRAFGTVDFDKSYDYKTQRQKR
jgi:Arc/MetJ family transcription regulator